VAAIVVVDIPTKNHDITAKAVVVGHFLKTVVAIVCFGDGIIVDLVPQFFELDRFGSRIFGRFNLVPEFLEGLIWYPYFLKWFSLVPPVII